MRMVGAILWFAAGLCFAAPGTAELVVNDLRGVAYHPFEPGAKLGSVVIFYWHDCPVCNSYAPEINRIYASYTNFAFYLVQVDPDLTPAAAQQHAREYNLQPPILLDPRHRLVKLAKATVTPEAVVFGKEGRPLYRGRIDDLYGALGKKRPTATRHDLVETLDAISSGKRVTKEETKPVGCLIPRLDR